MNILNILVGSLRRSSLNPPLGVVQVRIDRSSVLGNPFDMGSDEGLREAVIEAHSAWLDALLHNPALDAVKLAVGMAQRLDLKLASAWKRPSTREMIEALYEIARQAQQQPVWIMCWCAPSACHGDAYAEVIQSGAVEAAYRKLQTTKASDQEEVQE